MQKQTVLISGASIAGPALAFWLSRYGYEVTVLENAPALRPGGHAVDFRGAAINVLSKMGLLDEVRKYETRTEKVCMVNKQNRSVAQLPDGFTSGELEILRGDLAQVLYNATCNDAQYIFGDTITAMHDTMEGVTVSFKRGMPRRFDLVIGADGLHSNVRALAFGPEADFVRHMGYYISIFTVPNYLQQGMDGLYYGAPGHRVGLFGARKGTEAKASFFFHSPALTYDRHNIYQQQAILRESFKDAEWQVPALLKLMDEAPDFYFDALAQVKMERWSTGRICLLGDAAWCGSPMTGMGTSMAVVGAYILAGELAHAGNDHAAAFARYEAQMRPFVTKCQAMADGVDWFIPNTRFKFWMSQQMWKLLPYTPWKNMMIEMPGKIARSIALKEYVHN